MENSQNSLQRALDPRQLNRTLPQLHAEFFNGAGLDLNQRIVDLLQPQDRQATVLDIGCGAGIALEQIAKQRARIKTIGVDLTPLPFNSDMRTDFREGCATQLPLKDNSIDFGFSYATLIYVRDALKALEEIHRVLKPGGWFYAEAHKNAICTPDFHEVLANSPGAPQIFQWHQDRTDPWGGYIEIHKPTEVSEFTGFPYTCEGLARPYYIERLWQDAEQNTDFEEFIAGLPNARLKRQAHHKLGLYERQL